MKRAVSVWEGRVSPRPLPGYEAKMRTAERGAALLMMHTICVTRKVRGIDPESAHNVRLPDGAGMPVAAFGTFH